MFLIFFFVSCFYLLDLLYFLSSNKSYFLDDEADNDRSDSGSVGMCAFTFRFQESVGCVEESVGHVGDAIGCVCGVGSGFFPRQELIHLVKLFRWLCLYQYE